LASGCSDDMANRTRGLVATTTLLLRQFYATMLVHRTEGAEDVLKRAEEEAATGKGGDQFGNILQR
jgi:hypothetical protein